MKQIRFLPLQNIGACACALWRPHADSACMAEGRVYLNTGGRPIILWCNKLVNAPLVVRTQRCTC